MTLGLVLAVVALALLGGVSTKAVTPGARVRVFGRERLAGVHPSLLQLLDEWEQLGTHDVEIPSYPPAGLRTDADTQARLADGGFSGATTLASTPHGRGAAIDVWPVGFAQHVNGTWAAVPAAIKGQFQVFGEFAEARGFTWGGRWRTATLPNGDQPHVELKNWRTLPFPPPPGGYTA